MIEMTQVESKMVAAHGYDPTTQTLAIVYKNGKRFDYRGVEPEVAAGLASAESIGKYVNSAIKGGGYEYEAVDTGAEGEEP